MARTQAEIDALILRYKTAFAASTGGEAVLNYCRGWFNRGSDAFATKMRWQEVVDACGRLEKTAATKEAARQAVIDDMIVLRSCGITPHPEAYVGKKGDRQTICFGSYEMSVMEPCEGGFVVSLGPAHPRYEGDGFWAVYAQRETALCSLYSIADGGIRVLKQHQQLRFVK